MIDSTHARWYCINSEGLATLCVDQKDATKVAAESDADFPRFAPHAASRMVAIDNHTAEWQQGKADHAEDFIKSSYPEFPDNSVDGIGVVPEGLRLVPVEATGEHAGSLLFKSVTVSAVLANPVNVATIGHITRGKSALTGALMEVAQRDCPYSGRCDCLGSCKHGMRYLVQRYEMQHDGRRRSTDAAGELKA